MQPARRSLVPLVAVLAASAACKYDWPLPVADAGAPAADAMADSPADAPTVDGDTRFSCTGATFCDAFDDGPLTPHWDDIFTGTAPGGTVRAEAVTSTTSPPNALLALRTAEAVTSSAAYITKVIDVPFTHATLSFKVRPEIFDPTNAKACVAGIVFNDNADAHFVRILAGNGKASLQEKAGPINAYPLVSAPPLKTWSTMTLSIDVPGDIVVRMDGVVMLQRAADPSWTKSTSTRIVLGINFVDTAGSGFAFHFDDVRFDGS